MVRNQHPRIHRHKEKLCLVVAEGRLRMESAFSVIHLVCQIENFVFLNCVHH